MARFTLRPMLQTPTGRHLHSRASAVSEGPVVQDWISSRSESQPTWNLQASSLGAGHSTHGQGGPGLGPGLVLCVLEVPQFVYPFPCWWIVRLFPVCGYYR